MENYHSVKGKQSIEFARPPYIVSSASIAGKKEAEGPLGDLFDVVGKDNLFGEETWEEAESALQKEACLLALQKAKIGTERTCLPVQEMQV